jgi:hypothetical protein
VILILCATFLMTPMTAQGNPECFTPQEMRQLSEFKTECDVCRLDLHDCQSTLQKVIEGKPLQPLWWQKRENFVVGLLVSVVVGGSIVYLTCSKGRC